jgi:hypothetical protein
MASAKVRRIVARLEQIKDQAAQAAVNADQVDPGLAEEAAGLGLELAEEKK